MVQIRVSSCRLHLIRVLLLLPRSFVFRLIPSRFHIFVRIRNDPRNRGKLRNLCYRYLHSHLVLLRNKRRCPLLCLPHRSPHIFSSWALFRSKGHWAYLILRGNCSYPSKKFVSFSHYFPSCNIFRICLLLACLSLHRSHIFLPFLNDYFFLWGSAFNICYVLRRCLYGYGPPANHTKDQGFCPWAPDGPLWDHPYKPRRPPYPLSGSI